MITARFYRKYDKIYAFNLSGHAETARKGKDIVCAGVSACCELVLNGITEVLQIDAAVTVDEQSGCITCVLPEDCENNGAYAMIDALRLEIELISGEYPRAVKMIIENKE